MRELLTDFIYLLIYAICLVLITLYLLLLEINYEKVRILKDNESRLHELNSVELTEKDKERARKYLEDLKK